MQQKPKALNLRNWSSLHFFYPRVTKNWLPVNDLTKKEFLKKTLARGLEVSGLVSSLPTLVASSLYFSAHCNKIAAEVPSFMSSLQCLKCKRTGVKHLLSFARICLFFWEGKPSRRHEIMSYLPKLGAAAAAKSLLSCPTLCDPIDGNPPGSPIPGILQARTLEWVAISFSNAWKWKVKSENEVTQSCPTLSDPVDCSLPGSSVHGIFQARVLEWIAIAFSTNWMAYMQKVIGWPWPV